MNHDLQNPPDPSPSTSLRHASPLVQFVSIVCILLGSVCFVSVCVAGEPARAREAAKKSAADTTWYDPDKDSTEAIEVQTHEDDTANRSSRWDPDTRKKKQAGSTTTPTTPAGGTGSNPFASLLEVASFLSWGVIIALIVALAGYLIYIYLGQDKKKNQSKTEILRKQRREEDLASSIEKLPVKVSLSQGDLLSEADRLAAAGRFDLAIIYLFGQTLVQLDRRHRIRLSLGKTNGQYLRELQQTPSLEPPTREIISTFESSYFGGHHPTSDRFQSCRNLYQSLERELSQIVVAAILLLCLLPLTGCSKSINSQYGGSRGPVAEESVNGMTTLRGMFSHYGWNVRDDRSLNPRLGRASVIVLPLRSHLYLTPQATQWLTNWLQSAPNRTVILIPSEYDATLDYWNNATPLANPKQRVEYRRQHAQALTAQLARIPAPAQSNEWFDFTPEPVALSGPCQGDWIDALENDSGSTGKLSLQIPIVASLSSPTSPGTGIQFTPQLQDDRGRILIAEVTSSSWPQSKILVVASGAPLVNYSLLSDDCRLIAGQLIESCGSPNSGRTVFVEAVVGQVSPPNFGTPVSMPAPIPIRDETGDNSAALGMELLVKWPFNLASMHAAAIGLIALIAMSPIFGRPRRWLTASRTDFGKHLTALGEMLHRVGDKTRAQRQISDYFVQVRGETEGPWILPPEERPSLAKVVPVNQVPLTKGPFFSFTDSTDSTPPAPPSGGQP